MVTEIISHQQTVRHTTAAELHLWYPKLNPCFYGILLASKGLLELSSCTHVIETSQVIFGAKAA